MQCREGNWSQKINTLRKCSKYESQRNPKSVMTTSMQTDQCRQTSLNVTDEETEQGQKQREKNTGLMTVKDS